MNYAGRINPTPELLEVLERLSFEGELLEHVVVAAEELMVKSSDHADALNWSLAKHLRDKLDKQLQIVIPLVVLELDVGAFDLLNETGVELSIKGWLAED